MKIIKVTTAVILGIALCGPAMAEGASTNGTAGATGSVSGSQNSSATNSGSMQSDAPKGTNTDPNPLIVAPGAQPQPKGSTDTPAK